MHPLTARSVRLLVPLFIAALAGCAFSPPPPPAPAPVAKPSVVVPVAQLDRGVQIVLPDTLLFETGKLNCNPPPLRRLQTFVNCATQDRPIELLGSPTVAVATKLRTGEVATFRSGDLNLAMRASSSVPDVFIPPKIDDVDFVDGGL